MRSRLLTLLFVVPVLGLALLPAPQPVHGCAPAPRRGEYVDIATETAAIFWDAKTKTQHFIRVASFTTTSADFGFLVPTPTQPELAEAPRTLFDSFSAQTAAKYEYRTNVQELDPPGGCGDGNFAASAPKSAAAPGGMVRENVQVLGRTRVGGYDAVSLKADDAASLLQWLEKNGYDARAELKSWLQWYTDNKWVITAFKIAAESDEGPSTAPTGRELPVATARTIARNAAASAVRMSFKTERPFFPYREPEDQRTRAATINQPRLLRVFFVSEGRFDGTLGATGDWPGQTVWSKELAPAQLEFFATPAGVTVPKDGSWTLTEFEDKSSPRPGTDEVYFAKAADQSAVERPPIVVWNTEYKYRDRSWGAAVIAAAVAVPVLVLIGVLIVWRLVRRPI